MTALYILLAVLCGVLLFIIIAAYICFMLTFSVPKSTQSEDKYHNIPRNEQYQPYRDEFIKNVDATVALPFEDVQIKSDDGLTLYGRYYEASENAPLKIFFHGYRSISRRDFCVGLRDALARGYNAILVDQRAHGKSDGKCLTFGITECKDCALWIDYALKRFGQNTEIVLYGMSMGAATVLMAGGLPLPSNVKAIVADCGYTSPAQIIKKVLRDKKLPVFPTYNFIRLGGRIFGGFDIESFSAEDAMRKCNIPVLFFHGDDDRFVPCEMGRRNFEACAASGKELEIFQGAGHGMSYFADKKRYSDTLDAFLKCNIGVGEKQKANV